MEFVLTNQNHTQTISNKPNKHMKYWRADSLPEAADDWVTAAEEFSGSWREHWIDWLKQRSGGLLEATNALGNETYPELDPAPGRYVFEK